MGRAGNFGPSGIIYKKNFDHTMSGSAHVTSKFLLLKVAFFANFGIISDEVGIKFFHRPKYFFKAIQMKGVSRNFFSEPCISYFPGPKKVCTA